MKKLIIFSLASLLYCTTMAQNQRNERGGTQLRTERNNQSQPRRGTTQTAPQRNDRDQSSRRESQSRPVYSGSNRPPVYSGGNNYHRNPHIDVNARRYYGQQYSRLPRGAACYHYNNHDYYCHDGRYYRPYNNRYVVCRPPVGAVIAASIIGAAITAITIDAATPKTYYYDDGTYYSRGDNNQYTVIVPPIGARITALPYGCEELVLNGNYYYKVDDTYYRPIHNPRTGREEYEVVGQSIR